MFKSKLPCMKPFLFLLPILYACSGDKEQFDASGTFEATETIISADATGTIKKFDVEEGQLLKAGQQLGYVDSVQLYLKKKQLQSKNVSKKSGLCVTGVFHRIHRQLSRYTSLERNKNIRKKKKLHPARPLYQRKIQMPSKCH